MKTPKEYTQNLKNKIITKNMLLDALYSSNKRAKNYRDKEREYRDYFRHNYYAYDKYDNVDKCRNKKEEYYQQKDKMLSILNPICIHIEHYGYEKRRIYDYEKDYRKYKEKNTFVWENCYWDYEEEREVWFGDILLKDEPLYHYYLFYDLGGEHTFHSPIDEDELDNYDLERIEIETLNTFGKEIQDLISNQFVTKLIQLIETGDYTLDLN